MNGEALRHYQNGDKQKACDLLILLHQAYPTDTSTLNNLGKVAMELGRFTLARYACEKILALNPIDTRTLSHLAGIYADMGETEMALDLLRKGRELNDSSPENHSDLLITLHYSKAGEQEIYNEHLRFGQTFDRPQKRNFDRYKHHKKTRIGYVLFDLPEGACWYILRAILPHHNKDQFQIYIYWTHPSAQIDIDTLFGDNSISRLTPYNEPAKLRAQITTDEIDILIDLSGHTAGNILPLFGERLAPIQASWFGYMDTSGLSQMDYRITDRVRMPPEREKYYTETPLFLPDSYLFEPLPAEKRIQQKDSSLPIEQNGFITFGSFHRTKKIGDQVLETWSELLYAIPDAHLLLVADPSEEWRHRALGFFIKRGVSLSRVQIIETQQLAHYLKLVESVDIALDAFPYSSGITAYHAISVGVPMITLLGSTEYARNGAAIMKSVGLSDFIAQSHSEYIDIAVSHSKNKQRLAEIRHKTPALLGSENKRIVHALEDQLLRIREGKKPIDYPIY